MSQPSTDDYSRLMQFLDDEVRQEFYADLLLERTEAAAKGVPQLNASGNSYNVTFGRQKVVIEHHYLKDWPPVRLAPREFISALQSRRAQLG